MSHISIDKVACGVTGSVAVLGLGAAHYWFLFQPLADLLVGLATALVLAALAQGDAHARTTRHLKRVLELSPLLALGRMSYSLYLTHLPIVALVTLTFRERWNSLLVATLALLGSLSFAALFYWTVERPFLGHRVPISGASSST
jgi:peptidoglycan/LPS O-acetylase OafA/YrhL